jgi:AAA family ATP:ADP antiporter
VDERAVIGGSAWEGLRAVFRSPYLAGIAAYMLILAVIATFLYFTRLQMVAALGEDLDMRTTVFARSTSTRSSPPWCCRRWWRGS